MTEPREAPIVRWDPGTGLVDESGHIVTRAQEYKARKILDGGLLRFVGLREIEDHVRVVSEYHCAAVPGAKQSHTLLYTMQMESGILRHSFACDCQAFRGTRTSKPRACSHTIALSELVRAERARVTGGC